MKLITALFAGLLLVGCATPTKLEMTNEEYTRYAKTGAVLNYCIWQGWITPDTAALGKRYLESNVRSYSVDFVRLNKEEAFYNKQEEKPTRGNCNELAASIHSRYQTIQANNQSSEYNNQQTQELINSTKIRNTYCNRIGTSTLCSTY